MFKVTSLFLTNQRALFQHIYAMLCKKLFMSLAARVGKYLER